MTGHAEEISSKYPLSSNITARLESSSIASNQEVTPWDVKGEVVDGVSVGIDYDKLMSQFGCQPLSAELIERFEKVTGHKAHVLMRRGMFYCQRDLATILDLHEQGKPFYLYTGRGPSSESMHLGHMIPFVFCKYLQDVFDCNLVIQMTDDEKFLFKESLSLDDCERFTTLNARDIIAVGFNPAKTFIFSDVQYFGYMYRTVLRVQKLVNYNQARSVFGFTDSDAIGKISFPATQIAPSFSEAFPHLFGGRRDVPCLIPYAIDQDPYFRVCRDIAPRLKFHKPASICSQFFPALQGHHTKMSASAENTAIFMTDTPAQIKDKINKYAFSGGQDTLELQRERGANVAVDISFQYLRFFLDDDKEVERIGHDYAAGRLLTGEVKARCIEVLQTFVASFQARRAAVTDELLDQFTRMPPTAREAALLKQLSENSR